MEESAEQQIELIVRSRMMFLLLLIVQRFQFFLKFRSIAVAAEENWDFSKKACQDRTRTFIRIRIGNRDQFIANHG